VIWLVGLFLVLALCLIGLAIWRRPFVRASLNFWRVGFSLEAKNEETDHPKLPS